MNERPHYEMCDLSPEEEAALDRATAEGARETQEGKNPFFEASDDVYPPARQPQGEDQQ